MPPINLFDEDDNPDDVNCKGKGRAPNESNDTFQYNETYAQNFERRKRGEELMRLKEKYGEDYEPSETDEDFSSEDSDAEFITPEVDAAILKTLARIKKSDPKLYEGEKDVFQEEEAQNALARSNKVKCENAQPSHRQKPMHLRDYHRKALLANDGLEFDQDDSHSNQYQQTPAQEAEALREETKRAFHTMDDDEENLTDSSDEVQNLLVPREKNLGEMEQEDQDYRQFLLDQVGSDDIQTALRLSPEQHNHLIKKDNCETSQQDDEQFLRNYVLGRGWIDKEAKKIPQYKEIIGSTGRSQSASKCGPSGANASVLGKTMIEESVDAEDEEFVDKAEEFETKYNFRFEEPDPAVITHARDTAASVRRKDETRKLAREAVKVRKAEEKQQRVEEMNRLKELKKKEVIEKLDIIRKNAGAEDCNLDDLDLDSDFDPDSHDRRMGKVFDNGFYNQADPDGKPVWDDEIEIDDIIPPTNLEEPGINFEPGGDAYDPSAPSQKMSKHLKRLSRKQKKRGRTEDFDTPQDEPPEVGEAVDLEGLSPEERRKKLFEALDEYHQLDFEDMIGDLPTRFKYTKVEATDLMTPSQILMATDAELNEVIGLKKLAPYRTTSDRKPATRKKKLKELREKLKTRKWGDSINQAAHANEAAVEVHSDTRPAKKRKGKKERQKLKAEKSVQDQTS